MSAAEMTAAQGFPHGAAQRPQTQQPPQQAMPGGGGGGVAQTPQEAAQKRHEQFEAATQKVRDVLLKASPEVCPRFFFPCRRPL